MEEVYLETTARELLRDAYDLHIHSAPSHFPRSADDLEVMQQAAAAGMKGICIKSHYEPTGARAMLLNRMHASSGTTAYGSVVLNHTVGGLNVYAVHSALHLGASIVYMPTRDAEKSLRYGDMPGDFFWRPGITILDEMGKIKREVYDILDLVKEHNAALATGHLGTDESIYLCREGVRRGVRMILTHPDWERTVVPLETQKELADAGVWIEKCWNVVAEKCCSMEQLAYGIRQFGPQQCFLSSDMGKKGFDLPVHGMLRFLQGLLRYGIPKSDLARMARQNPGLVLGLTV